MAEETTVKGKYLLYKGKPLVREGNTICYGNMDDEYILFMMIMSMKTEGGREVPDKVIVQILKTDTSLPAHERIEKQDIKNSLYEAFDIGTIWLERLVG